MTEIRDYYRRPQCGPDPAGEEAHAETHHTLGSVADLFGDNEQEVAGRRAAVEAVLQSGPEALAEALYSEVMPTWEDQWPLWEYADDEVKEWCRRTVAVMLATQPPQDEPQPDERGLCATCGNPVRLVYIDGVRRSFHDGDTGLPGDGCQRDDPQPDEAGEVAAHDSLYRFAQALARDAYAQWRTCSNSRCDDKATSVSWLNGQADEVCDVHAAIWMLRGATLVSFGDAK